MGSFSLSLSSQRGEGELILVPCFIEDTGFVPIPSQSVELCACEKRAGDWPPARFLPFTLPLPRSIVAPKREKRPRFPDTRPRGFFFLLLTKLSPSSSSSSSFRRHKSAAFATSSLLSPLPFPLFISSGSKTLTCSQAFFSPRRELGTVE